MGGMKLDYLSAASPENSIVRLYDFTTDEASQLATAIQNLASERERQLCVHALPCVTAVDGCRLTLIRKGWDQAILKTGNLEFECGLTAGTWDNVAGRIEAFVLGESGYQFLAGSPGEAMLLLSVSGDW
jgi:hypothetical protein